MAHIQRVKNARSDNKQHQRRREQITQDSKRAHQAPSGEAFKLAQIAGTHGGGNNMQRIRAKSSSSMRAIHTPDKITTRTTATSCTANSLVLFHLGECLYSRSAMQTDQPHRQQIYSTKNRGHAWP